jgi:molybdate transport system regulatory protein
MSTRPIARFRLRVCAGDLIAIGPGKVELLEAISEHGSLTSAAKALGISYRRAWMMLDELSRALKRPAVETASGGVHGGGTALTPLGEELVQRYRRIEKVAAKACADDLDALRRMVRSASN